jgi:hypothetical protein
MSSRASASKFGVGYALSIGELFRGAIDHLHAVNPATGVSWCGRVMSLSWTVEDARGTQADCPACLAALELEPDV